MSIGETRRGYPSSAAGKFVKFYIERKQAYSGVVISTMPAIARSSALLDFELEEPLQIRSCITGTTRKAELVALVGIETYAKHYFLIEGNYQGFQIHFRPGALKELFGLFMPELTDQNHSASTILGAGVSDLWQQLVEAHSFEDRIRLADTFLVQFGSKSCIHSSIDQTAREIIRMQGNCSVDQLARDAGFSVRSFQRKFREQVGIPPKLYARLIRFETILRAKATASGMSWTEAAHRAGYYDQMHMIHDFRDFTGGSPTTMFGKAEQLLTPHADFKESQI